jgi:UDP-glucose 4-epimerase
LSEYFQHALHDFWRRRLHRFGDCGSPLRDSHQLRIFERPRVDPYRKFLDSEKVDWVTGDLLSVHDVGAAIDGSDAVIHLVSTTLPKSSNDDPIYDVQTNLVATLQLLNAMVAKKVGKIIFISSGGTIYGRPRYVPVDEAHPTDPEVSYGIVKLAIEKYLLMYERQHGIKTAILRVTNPFGERQRIETAQGAVGAFLHRALRGEPIEIWGDGSVTRDYVYIGDVVQAFASALTYSGTQSVFNISSGVGTSLNELIALLEKLLGRPVERRYFPGRTIDVPVNVLDNDLARRELGWEPKISVYAGLEKTAAWMRNELKS